MEGCLRARHILGKKIKLLENEAHKLAGKRFSLSMPADIANILYEHLKLPMREGYEGKQHHSTDKHCLEMLRYQIVSIVSIFLMAAQIVAFNHLSQQIEWRGCLLAGFKLCLY